ncbi:MAG: ABC transporter ATP-binding protein [Chloroflexi bacterium]|nr:MAG: ABC transporter ATP-binding protein [Chloroflexota bacterium]
MDNKSTAISITDVSKTYGRGEKSVTAVRNLSLEVQTNQVYGFLGPNGAGKSTTIRMMMGLLHLDRGDIQIFGKSIRQDKKALEHVGSLIEGASFYDFLSGYKNLEVLSRVRNCHDHDQLQLLLEQVRLAKDAHRPVQGYSTGMKQRLGMAAALLGQPDLVILDEPTNGLDPNGIKEMRRFIRNLATVYGKTVFLSSHLLSEVEQVCDRVAIIHKGQVVREGMVTDLLEEEAQVTIETDSVEKAIALFQDKQVTAINRCDFTISAKREEIPTIIRQLVANDVDLYQVKTKRQTLEDFFLSVTGVGEDD